MENGRCYKSGFWLAFGWFPEELLIKHLAAHCWGAPKGRCAHDAAAHGNLRVIFPHLREVQRALERESRDLSSRPVLLLRDMDLSSLSLFGSGGHLGATVATGR